MIPCLATAWLLFVTSAFGESLRVATWSFEASTNLQPQLTDAALGLKKLNPDVILLERVRDWKSCNDLAQALKPAEYSVLVCSAFRAPAGASAPPQQVAILSKRNGYCTWSEPWRVDSPAAAPGGFVFAAVQFGKHRVGFFATHLDPPALAALASADAQAALQRHWSRTVDLFKSWVTNRLGAVVVGAGDLPPDSRESELAVRFLSAPLERAALPSLRVTPATASTEPTPASVAADPRTVPSVVLVGPQANCLLNLDAPKPVAAPVALPKSASTASAPPPAATPTSAQTTTTPAPLVTPPASPAKTAPQAVTAPAAQSLPVAMTTPRPASPPERSYLIYGGAALAVFLTLAWWWARRRVRARRAPGPVALLSGSTVSSYTLVVPPTAFGEPGAAAAASIPHLVPQGQGTNRPAHPVEVWPPGPLLLSPKDPRADAQSRADLRAHFAHWLKQKFVQRLVADRSQLLQTQEAAAGKLLSFEERLARLELQLQQQNQDYEERIQELNRELLAAKEENRELIRARIAQVKAEMQAARAKLLAQARAGERPPD